MAPLSKQRQAVQRFFRRVFLLPAFNESPANSARLTGRWPLTSKPERPHRDDYDNSAVWVPTFATTASNKRVSENVIWRKFICLH